MAAPLKFKNVTVEAIAVGGTAGTESSVECDISEFTVTWSDGASDTWEPICSDPAQEIPGAETASLNVVGRQGFETVDALWRLMHTIAESQGQIRWTVTGPSSWVGLTSVEVVSWSGRPTFGAGASKMMVFTRALKVVSFTPTFATTP